MREIKFRAWETGHLKMVYLRSLQLETTLTENVFYFGCNDPREINIFMQYTGLKDKNGVEIYEGDLLQLFRHTKTLSEVKFGHQDIGHDFQGVGFYTQELGTQECFNIFDGDVEVVGNIYEKEAESDPGP